MRVTLRTDWLRKALAGYQKLTPLSPILLLRSGDCLEGRELRGLFSEGHSCIPQRLWSSITAYLTCSPWDLEGTPCFISSRFIENKTKRMGNSSADQSTSCSWRRPNFSSQHPLVMPHSAWNSSSMGIQHPLLTSESIAFRCNAHTHTS